jgi:hypothetical protein
MRNAQHQIVFMYFVWEFMRNAQHQIVFMMRIVSFFYCSLIYIELPPFGLSARSYPLMDRQHHSMTFDVHQGGLLFGSEEVSVATEHSFGGRWRRLRERSDLSGVPHDGAIPLVIEMISQMIELLSSGDVIARSFLEKRQLHF